MSDQNTDTETYVLRLTQNQARVVRDACECLARMSCGQFEIAWDLTMEHNPALALRQEGGEEAASRADWEEWCRLREQLDSVGRVAAARLCGHPHHLGMEPGISNPRVSDRARIARDVQQVVRKALHDAGEGRHTPSPWRPVDGDTPRRTSETEALPTITREEEGQAA